MDNGRFTLPIEDKANEIDEFEKINPYVEIIH